jgi:hypothetical protein
MKKVNVAIGLLIVALVVESGVIVALYNQPRPSGSPEPVRSYALQKTFTVPYSVFNQPISNDTEYRLDQSIDGSWVVNIQSQVTPAPSNPSRTEAQIAFAPEYPSENLSIPTIIVQERADGLLRIEYYAQDWEHTYGLVLYNSTSPSWRDGNITIEFVSYGPPVPVNPQLAPYPNGNLTITLGNTVVLRNYPIAWAGLSSLYVYGLNGSNFTGGSVTITVYEARQGS